MPQGHPRGVSVGVKGARCWATCTDADFELKYFKALASEHPGTLNPNACKLSVSPGIGMPYSMCPRATHEVRVWGSGIETQRNENTSQR